MLTGSRCPAHNRRDTRRRARRRHRSGRCGRTTAASCTGDASKLPGSRVDGVTVGGEPLDPSRTYRLATNDFISRCGDGYDMFAGALRLIDAAAGKLMAAQVIEAIAGEIAPRVEGRTVQLD